MRTYRRSRTERLRRSRRLRREAPEILTRKDGMMILEYIQVITDMDQDEIPGGNERRAQRVYDMFMKRFKVDPFQIRSTLLDEEFTRELAMFIDGLMDKRIISVTWSDILKGNFPG